MLRTYNSTNIHGRNSNPGVMTANRMRRIKSARKSLHHVTKNGAYDPLTYYHVLDALLDVYPGEVFRTREFLPFLAERLTNWAWDPVTVGRVIADISEALNDSLGYKVISVTRRYDGFWFDISSHEEARAAMERLLEDLEILSREEIENEVRGQPSKRLGSPLGKCPSVSM